MVYVGDESVIHIDHLQPKNSLTPFAGFARENRAEPRSMQTIQYENQRWQDIRHYSNLLHLAVKSIVDLNEEDSLDGFSFRSANIACRKTIEGLDDFELVCFLTVKWGASMFGLPKSTEISKFLPKKTIFDEFKPAAAERKAI